MLPWANLGCTYSQTIEQSKRLRMYGGLLPEDAFYGRVHDFTNAQHGKLNMEKLKQTGGGDPFKSMNEAIVGMMVFQLPAMLLMPMIDSFFAGFLTGKLPFVLTHNFSALVHRGIALESLETSYMSAMSWYVLLLFGLRGLRILLAAGEDVMDEATAMKMQMGMGGMGGGAKLQTEQLAKREKDNLLLVNYEDVLGSAESSLIASQPWE
jgi:ER membrane protein complex subunit 3